MRKLALTGQVLLIFFAMPVHSGDKLTEDDVNHLLQVVIENEVNSTVYPERSPELMLANCKKYVDDLQKNSFGATWDMDPEASWRGYYYNDFMRKKADIQIRTFLWQNQASEWLLWIVTAVVLSGIIFSAIQLIRAVSFRLPDKVMATQGQSKCLYNDGLNSSIEVSVKHLRITSSVVGIMVLSISLIFYYLFLTEVYHIQVIDTATKNSL